MFKEPEILKTKEMSELGWKIVYHLVTHFPWIVTSSKNVRFMANLFTASRRVGGPREGGKRGKRGERKK